MDLADKKRRLIAGLVHEGSLRSPAVIQAFRAVPRELFVPRQCRSRAYADEPLPIGFGQTISAPHMHARMTELLGVRRTDKILEIGAGSGYQTAILAALSRKVIAVEADPRLAASAALHIRLAGIRNATVVEGDGWHGWPKGQLYDKILVTCAVPEMPGPLIAQLKRNGLILGPVGSGWHQELTLGRKTGAGVAWTHHGSCAFVPLRSLARPKG